MFDDAYQVQFEEPHEAPETVLAEYLAREAAAREPPEDCDGDG